MKTLVFCTLLTAACSPSSSTPTSDGGTTCDTTTDPFVAWPATFYSFRTWPSDTFDGGAEPASPHLAGVRTEYINQKPDSGSTEFPEGTVIVKVITPPGAQPGSSSEQVFAMVKRCNFNSDGARNWEWFELAENGNNSCTQSACITWRGAKPGPGEAYATNTTSCNACHMVAASNDYVQSAPLQLRNF